MSRRTDRPRSVLCRSCGRLVSRDAETCAHCGARRPGMGQGTALGKALARLDITTTIMGVCIVMYVGSIVVTGLTTPEVLLKPKSWFGILAPSSRALVTLGATSGQHLGAGMVWTLLTASYQHGSILHIGFNLWFLRSLGGIATSIYGPARFFVLFSVAGIGGFLLSDLASGVLTIGASCSAFGIMGALAVFGWRRGGTAGKQIQNFMLQWVFLNVLFTAGLGGVNHWGHAGGFLAGAALAFVLPAHEGQRETTGWTVAAIAFAAVTVLGILASVGWTLLALG